MNWTWGDSLAIVVAGLSALGALWAAWVARAARRDIQKYSDAFWVVSYAPSMRLEGSVALRLKNVGETRATDVALVWDFDPFSVHDSGMSASVIEPGDYRDKALAGFHWSMNTNLNFFVAVADMDGRRTGTVTWKNVLEEDRTQTVLLPPTSELPSPFTDGSQ